MFSALRQGCSLYILEKGEYPNLKVGQVLSITSPHNNYLLNNTTIDINVRVGEENMEFKNVPSSQSVTIYNNVIIAETKELMSNEVDSLLQNSLNVINSVNYHTNIANTCEEILKELNPRFAKEKERDEDINNLKSKIGGIETKMDQILTLLTEK